MADMVVPTFRRSFKYRIYPTKAQIKTFESWLELCRELYNAALEERREAWKKGVSINYYKQNPQLPAIKKERPEFGEVYSQVLQDVLGRLDGAFQDFFRRIKLGQTPGYPRFKSRDRYNSMTWPQNAGFWLIDTNKLHLGNLGKVRIKLHRALEGRPKTCTVKREAGKWYALFSCSDVPGRVYPPATGEIGIDMGLTTYATPTEGEKVENPRWYRKTEAKLAIAQRNLSRKKRGSKNYAEAKQRLAKLRAKEANQRLDFQHKLAHRTVCENQLIAVEDLKPEEMIEKSSKGLSKSISDAAWAQFLAILACKAEEAGRQFVKVPAWGTSSTCSSCGTVKQKTLSERVHSCPCGLVLDRDINASLNILRLGRSLRDEHREASKEESITHGDASC